MVRIISAMFCLLLLIACDPFVSSATDNNQFQLKRQRLFFLDQDLVLWDNNKLPYCEYCTFNIHIKKMLPHTLLFKQVNSASGDLVFFIVTNVRDSFALQTGPKTYSMNIKKQADGFILTNGEQLSVVIRFEQKQLIRLGSEHYFVYFRNSTTKQNVVDIMFWKEASS